MKEAYQEEQLFSQNPHNPVICFDYSLLIQVTEFFKNALKTFFQI